MKNWRLYALLIGLAVFTGAGVALVLSGGFRSSEGVARASPSASAALSQRASPTATPRRSSTFAPTPSPTPSPSGAPALATLVRSAGEARRIAGTTLLLSASSGIGGTTLVAVPITANPSTPPPSGSPRPSPTSGLNAPFTIGSVGRNAGWALRADGILIVISLATAPDSARLATWNLRTDAVEWLTPDEPGVMHATPVWSADGALLYYASSRGTTDLGIWRIRTDGTQRSVVRRPDSGGSTIALLGLTPDGAGLFWSYDRVGGFGSANVFDLQSGTERAFDDTTASGFVAWRSARPRALVTTGRAAVLPPGTLTLWDDIAGAKKVLLGPDIAGSPDGVLGADFDPTGARIVIAAYSKIGAIEGSALNLIDLAGANRTLIAGSEGAQQVLWFRAGIVFTRKSASGGTDVLLIQPAGGTPVTLHSDPGQIGKLTFISP